MMGEDGVQWSAPLKAPAVEVVNLLSEGEDATDATLVVAHKDTERLTRDALEESEDDDDSQWSVYEEYLDTEEEALNGIGDLKGTLDQDHCTLNEALTFRKRLKLVGEDRFLQETVQVGHITVKKLITAFGIRPPHFLDGAPDDAYLPLLDLGISRELSKRIKLPQYNTVEDAVALLQKSRNIIVLTGAGISTSLGIPDFRSKDTGLYSQLQHLGLSDPQEVFDISLFREDPNIFYSVAKYILPSGQKFSPTHAFIRLLQDKGKLLTNFTQNIDNLEGYAGIDPKNLIQCHGSFASATCIECKYKVKGDVIYKDLKAGKVARCDRCIQSLGQASAGLKRKRNSNGSGPRKKKRQIYKDSSSGEDDDIAVAGVMKVSGEENGLLGTANVWAARYHVLWRGPTRNIPRASGKPRQRHCGFGARDRDLTESSTGLGSRWCDTS